MSTPLSGDPPRTGSEGADDDVELGAAWRPLVLGTREPGTRRRRVDGDLVVSAFFGSVVAAGMTGLLITVVAGLGSALGVSPGLGETSAAGASGAVSLMSRSALLGTVLLSYLSGGYVAVRMSRAGGPLLGLGVWVWAQVIAVVVVSLGVVTNSAGALPTSLRGQSGPGAVDWNLGAVSLMTILAMTVTALAGAWCGSTVGTTSWRRAARFRPAR